MIRSLSLFSLHPVYHDDGRFCCRSGGFTLVQTAVVLVIIGLIIGGTLVAKDMIRASVLHAVGSEVNRYRLAIATFNEKFGGYPGDLTNAETHWGSDAGCPNTASNTVQKQETCNGNGDHRIGPVSCNTGYSETYEWFRAWQQLANAQLIPDTFPGVSGPGSAQHTRVGINVPASKLNPAGYLLFFLDCPDGHAGAYPAPYDHVFNFGADTASGENSDTVLKPLDAYDLDAKLDDGKPASGNIMGVRSGSGLDCTTSDTASIAEYKVQYDNIACSLTFFVNLW